MGRKSTLDKEKIILLYKSGLTLRAIAKEVNSNEDAIRMLIKRNALGELNKRKEKRKNKKTDYGFEFEHSEFLSQNDLKEIREERSYGIMPNESIGDYGFLKVNRQSYILSENHKKLIFDESRGLRTYAVPKSY
ncbi:RNA polymerase subunit sigma-24 [Clostridium estertheticum]|uniref:RNA polymerase subunit sigma-24 n=1 Tax=Clostridium estertheticum TaxID=238834 RepID=UPI001CF2F77F|nr:RNA polymerase subunit sigma-24 [Clostridium estertheticum]MCB2309257.1 RNA polymerase subunit sigma-24 [Clostridium estertheticum]MCB2346790.1 RNA polymerase subunit sigma-24 [Clostridium estertheticum]MCB2352232.1 RNA polymerase subunit sigma-24 [Clostridium estertheticum]WAG48563.1 RNA polymerase subunit sigma-24 [Clostridium estertheticum]